MSGTRPVYTIAKEMGLASKVLVEAIGSVILASQSNLIPSRLSAAEEKLLDKLKLEAAAKKPATRR